MNGCKIWLRAKDTKGYGQLRVNSRLHRAHRWFYEQLYGPIPVGYDLHHLCETPACVNPEHLLLVPHNRHPKNGLNFNRKKTHCPQGHEYTYANIYWGPSGDRHCLICKRRRAQQQSYIPPRPNYGLVN